MVELRSHFHERLRSALLLVPLLGRLLCLRIGDLCSTLLGHPLVPERLIRIRFLDARTFLALWHVPSPPRLPLIPGMEPPQTKPTQAVHGRPQPSEARWLAVGPIA